MINERKYIKDALYDWVSAVIADNGLAVPVVWANGDGPRISPPFIVLQQIDSREIGTPDFSQVKTDGSDDGKQTMWQNVRKSMTMRGYGESAIDLLETIRASIWQEKYIEMLQKQNLVIPDALGIVENPMPRDSEIENAASFDFYVTYTRAIEDVPGWIETADVSGDFPPQA